MMVKDARWRLNLLGTPYSETLSGTSEREGLANPVASCVGQWYKMIGSLELPRPRLDDTSSFQSIDIGDSGSGRVAVFHRFPPLLAAVA
jgi:hypothetical protein